MFLQTDYFNRQVASEDNTGYNVVPYGFFTYRHMSDDLTFYFNLNEIVEKGIVSTLYPVFTTSSDLNSHFLRAYLNYSKRFASYCVLQKQGGSRTYMYFKKLCAHIAVIPSYKEQNKLATFIDLIDRRIKLQEELIETFKKYKRGVLKAILEQRLKLKQIDGSEYPRWESYTLSKIAECLDRLRVPITSNERIKGIYPYYGANGIQDYVTDYIFDGEFVLLAEDGGHFNDFATESIAQYVSGKIWVNNHAHILKAKCNTHFLYYSLVHKDIRNYINNPSRGKLNQEDMQGIVIDLPSMEEQERIVQVMLILDKSIEAKVDALNQLIDLKKGALQQLFI